MCNNRTSEYLTFFVVVIQAQARFSAVTLNRTLLEVHDMEILRPISKANIWLAILADADTSLFYIIVQMQTNHISTFEVIMLQMKFFLLCEQAH